MNKNIIALMKGFVCPSNDGMDNRILVSTVQANLMQYGYMLTEDAFAALGKSNHDFIVDFHDETINFLRKAMGGKNNYKPFYANFPNSVMQRSEMDLFFNAIRHYWTNGDWVINEAEMPREVKFEKVKYTMIELGDEARFDKVFTDLVSVNQSIAPQDMKIVEWFAKSGRELVFPDVIPFKENLCTLAAMGLKGLPVKTPTDVLRIAVHMSGGDISLPSVPAAQVRTNRWSNRKSDNPERDKFKFKKFKRAERKYLLSLLESTHCNPAEMVLKDQRWIRLGEILHPGEYKSLYPKAFEAFKAIRNDKVQSWYGQLDAAFKESFDKGLNKLSERPGEFIRRLDWMLRTTGNEKREKVIKTFRDIAEKSSNKVLFEAYGHFENRLSENPNRSIMIKGARKKTKLPTLKPMSNELVENVHQTIFGTLKYKFSTLEPLGNVWIDEELKKVPIPSNMRSVDFSLKPTVRGTRIPWDNPEAKVIRAFYHWEDARGEYDPDLSATFVGQGKVDTLSYSGLKVGKSCHSGDIICRPGNNAEYVDIAVADAIERGYQYVVIDVRNFRGGSLKVMNGVFGIMEREHPESNKHWLPETIKNCQQSNSTASVTMMSVLDLHTKEYIFLDIDSEGVTYARGDRSNIMQAIEDYTKPPKFSVYDLALLHAEARGKKVTLDSKEEINTMFKFDDFVHSYEQVGKLMGI